MRDTENGRFPGEPGAEYDEAGERRETPAERRRRKVRANIVEVAERVFAEEGEEGLSMRRLAEAIDYSPAAIYKYFKSKEELLEEITEHFYERLGERLDASVESERFDKDTFCAFARAYVETGLENPNHYRMAFLGYDRSQPSRGQAQLQVGGRYAVMIQGLIRAGVFAEVDPRLAAMSAWSSLHGLTRILSWAVQAERNPADDPLSGFSMDEIVGFHIERLFSGFKA